MLRDALRWSTGGVLAVYCGALLADHGIPQWRSFGPEHGMIVSSAISVTVSPRGTVWIRHPGMSGVSGFDGFDFRRLPAMDETVFSIREGRSAQLWALYPDGVAEYRAEGWMLHPVEFLRARRGAQPGLSWRPVGFVPAERDRVLVLLGDALLKFEAPEQRSSVVLTAAQLRIGEFVDLLEGRDGSVWLIGLGGVAKVPGPARWVTAETHWDVRLLDEEHGLRLTGSGFETDDGGLVVRAVDASGNNAWALRFDGNAWREPLPTPDGTRNVWGSLEGGLWAHTSVSLSRWDGNEWTQQEVPELKGGQIFDVAPEPGGVFWLATSTGLFRHAPSLWRPPGGADVPDQGVFCVREGAGGSVWFLSQDGLISYVNRMWRTDPFPDDLAPAEGTPMMLIEGRWVFLANDGSLAVHSPDDGRFSRVHPERPWRIRKLLGFDPRGRLVVQVASESGEWRLLTYEGEEYQGWIEPDGTWDFGDQLHFVQTTSGGQVWLGTSEGLGSWDERSGTFVRSPSYVYGEARGMVEVAPGRLWCVGQTAVVENDGRGWVIRRPGFGNIERMVQVRDGGVWVITESSLIGWVTGVWIELGSPEGLPAGTVRDVIQNQRGDFW
jgi:ligand-binding sensor domain-containing protein